MVGGRDRWEEFELILSRSLGEKDSKKLLFVLNDSVKYEVEKAVGEVRNDIDKLSADLCETRYLNHHGRSIKQRLETKFSTIYLMTKKKNGSIKNALINIRGYRSIKRNQLFDIGYYLYNNPDVMQSGDDPIMHYIYYGYKEGRNPSADFDGDYYLQNNPELMDLNLNPLVHYSLYGLKEGKKLFKEVMIQ